MNDLIAKYEEQNLNLVINQERLVARCERPSPRARLGVKIEFNYRFNTVERMTQYIERFIEDRIESKKNREERKIVQKLQSVQLADAVKVGDLFVDSWGFEQTQVDLYQVVSKPSAKTVIVRPIACETVEGSEGHDCRNVRAVPNAFIGEEMKKRLDNYGGFKTSSFSSARPTTAEAKHYNSWYY
jgi:hypothetical protein